MAATPLVEGGAAGELAPGEGAEVEEEVGLLVAGGHAAAALGAAEGEEAHHDAEIREAILSFRRDCWSRAEDILDSASGRLTLLKARFLSLGFVVRVLWTVGRVAFLADYASDGVVAKSLRDNGNPRWSEIAVSFMLVPYAIMVMALRETATRKISETAGLSLRAARVLWFALGGPICLLADIYLSFCYLFSEPADVRIFHYFTLRGIAEIAEGFLQLGLQSYIGFRLSNPYHILAEVGGAVVNPYLLALSMALSLRTVHETLGKLNAYSQQQTGGSKRRFFSRMSKLGEGLAPSNLSELLEMRRAVEITCDLSRVTMPELRRLAIAARRSAVLEELNFHDSSWVIELSKRNQYTQQAVELALGDFSSARLLKRLEFRGAKFPQWAHKQISKTVRTHKHLRQALIEGHDPIPSDFLACLHSAHPVVRAADSGDVACLVHWPTGGHDGSPPPVEALAQAMALAAADGSVDMLRALLLLPGGLPALGEVVEGDVVGGSGAPLHYVRGHTAELLLVARADANQRNCVGATPLFCAARESRPGVVGALLDAQANIEQASDLGITPIYIAAQNNNIAVLGKLLAARGNMERSANDGATPVFCAACLNSVDSLSMLLAARADVDKAANDGRAPVYAAAWGNSVEALSILLAARADVGRANNAGGTPVHAAASGNSVEALSILLAARSNVDKAENDGWAPVHWAAQENSVEALSALLAARANPNCVDQWDETAADVAARFHNAQALELLLAAGVPRRHSGGERAA